MPDEINWNEVWRAEMARHLKCSPSFAGRNRAEEIALARQYLTYAQEHAAERIRAFIARLTLSPASRVLDIGAGPGVMAVPLARLCSRVTVVEPSQGMVAVLRENMAKNGLENIDIVQSRWEEVDVDADLTPPYDIVIASYSLSMSDIQEAIEKMAAVSSGWVFLSWFGEGASWEEQAFDLWPALHGTDYIPPPYADVLFNVLIQMEVYPNVEFQHFSTIERFATVKDAVEQYWLMFMAISGEQRETLGEYLSTRYADSSGGITVPEDKVPVTLWWRTGNEPALQQ